VMLASGYKLTIFSIAGVDIMQSPSHVGTSIKTLYILSVQVVVVQMIKR